MTYLVCQCTWVDGQAGGMTASIWWLNLEHIQVLTYSILEWKVVRALVSKAGYKLNVVEVNKNILS